MPELDPRTLLVLVPALPLVGALVTVLLGRRLGPRAHWPAIVSIAAAATTAVLLLIGLASDVSEKASRVQPVPPVEMVTTLWQWATVPEAYVPAAGTPAAEVGEDLAARAAGIPAALPF